MRGTGRANLGCFIVNKKGIVHGFGRNEYNVDCNNCITKKKKDDIPDTKHAEVSAVDNMRPNHKKHPVKVDVVVFRVLAMTNTEQYVNLGMAKSCEACKRYISRGLAKKNYRLRRLLYTDISGNWQIDRSI